MQKYLLICGFLIFSLSARVSYAANGKPVSIEKADAKKQTCKTSEKLIPEKLLRIKPLDVKSPEKPQAASSTKTPAAANTFETLITPFIKAVAPHFYDQIIKKDPRPSTAQS